jgi:hypothetical protein
MRFFSNGTWRPRSPSVVEIPTPVGEPCLAYGEPIQADDCGVSMAHMDVPRRRALPQKCPLPQKSARCLKCPPGNRPPLA